MPTIILRVRTLKWRTELMLRLMLRISAYNSDYPRLRQDANY